MRPKTRKSQVPAPARPHKRPYQSARSGKISTDVRMRSPSPAGPRAVLIAPDNDSTFINDNDEDWTDEAPAAHDEDVYFRWEEEATLFSDLLEEAPEAGDAKLIALAESLQGPFDEESRQLKKEIARTFVPLVNKVKEIYVSIDKNVDVPFGVGLLATNDAYKEAEKSFAGNAKVVQRARAEHRKHVSELLQQLEEEYARREQLWVNFQRAMDELVNPVLEMLNETPAKMERTIATMEKQGRALDKEAASAPAEVTAQALQNILRKLRA